MLNLVLDIETLPSSKPGLLEEIRATIQAPGNMSKPETIAKWMEENADVCAQEKWRKTALDGTQGELAVIGFAVGDEPPTMIFRNSLAESEGDLLQNAFDLMPSSYSGVSPVPRVVGHNVIAFDVRFLYQRAVILGIKPPFPLPVDRRYNDDRIFCSMLAWSGWGNHIGLARLCAALGIPCQQNGVDGSMIFDLFQAGRVEEIVQHCREDVVSAREVFKRLNFGEV
jgi:hypothetical protein